MPRMRRRAGLLAAAALALSGMSAAGQGLKPEEALRRMEVAEGFEASLVASEPDIRQPVSMSFDERGRMWVIQYLQYPAPAGLKVVEVDQYLRTRYDRMPEPPPRGPRGADRITICEDTDGDGKADKFKDFLTGLNLCTGLVLGHGGVFVLQSPYLLFYPDRNGDDAPDGDPEVLLSGFGMEDAHAFANSLQWGPDGWLYGAQGSTVTARIRGIEFQQGIWRYHPLTREFELFSEGGGNTWGLDFDEAGNIIAGTNFGDQIALHQMQGAYHLKNFGKHGELHNPYAFGYFGHIPYQGFIGGHVTCGGVVYQGGAFPPRFNGTYIAANLLANMVYWHSLEPLGSTFSGKFGGTMLDARDAWFRPVDCLTGPDGAVYVADWHDRRATHLDSADNWDRSNGRIYRIQSKGAPAPKPFNLAAMPSVDLLPLLSHSNDWFAREARRVLTDRADASVLPQLERAIFESKDPRLALNSLWTFYSVRHAVLARPEPPAEREKITPISESLAARLLGHSSPDVRSWTVRLLGDRKEISPKLSERLAAIAQAEISPVVRSQLAATARRLPGNDALPIVARLMARSEDATDPHLPLLLWWALENKAESSRAAVVRLFESPAVWSQPIPEKFLIERLARRFAAAGNPVDWNSLIALLRSAPDAAKRELALRGVEKAIAGRADAAVAPALTEAIRGWQRAAPDSAVLLRVAARLKIPEAQQQAVARASLGATPLAERIALVEALADGRDEALAEPLLRWIESSNGDASFQAAALRGLQGISQPAIASRILDAHPKMPAINRRAALSLLASRAVWAEQLIQAVDAGKLAKTDVPIEQVRQMSLLKNKEIDARLLKTWGTFQGESAEEKKNQINRLMLLSSPSGTTAARQIHLEAGRALFQKKCAVCHNLFGEGNNIGPNLTGADRKNKSLLLRDIIDPSAFIRTEYLSYNIETKDGQLLSGLMAESDPDTATLLNADNQRLRVPRSQIASEAASRISLMPEGLLDDLSEQELIDLLGYLQSDGPGNSAEAQK